MKKSVLEIYALAVCFVALTCFAISLGIGIKQALRLVQPELTLSAEAYLRHQSNEAFDADSIYRWDPDKGERRTPQAQLTIERQQSYQRVLAAEQRGGLTNLVNVLIILLVDVLVFWPHWRLARRARQGEPAQA